MAGQGVTQAEFARQNGWSRQYVNKLVKQGRIKVKGGRIDPVAAKKAIEELAEPSTVLPESPTPKGQLVPSSSYPVDNRKTVDFASARTMREAFRAKMAKMEYEEKAGKLTDASKVREDAFRAGRIIRDALLGIPDRLADILAAEQEPRQIRQLLEEELENILRELSRQ
ncbi:hypothetical protein [Endozoicomonas sp. Mp262]|uniref:hypothetical protein n=1 Tax=Endozoicomonas sp. Mp262 TaxID=2919499 RepID=UPI0021D8DCC2